MKLWRGDETWGTRSEEKCFDLPSCWASWCECHFFLQMVRLLFWNEALRRVFGVAKNCWVHILWEMPSLSLEDNQNLRKRFHKLLIRSLFPWKCPVAVFHNKSTHGLSVLLWVWLSLLITRGISASFIICPRPHSALWSTFYYHYHLHYYSYY